MSTKRTVRSALPAQRPSLAAPAGPGVRRQPLGLSEEIDLLGKAVQQLRIDFERFFSGALLFPPDELRLRIQQQLRSLRNTSGASAVDNFRLSDIEARFNSYNELHARRLRESEEGRRRQSPPSPPAAASRYDVQKGIIIDAEPTPQAIEALYVGLVAGGEAPRFDLASFGTYISRQASAIREKMGCESVQFRLVQEEGKVKLKARPVAGSKGP